MARKKKKTRRRRFTGINATNLLEGYLQTSVLTHMAFELNPFEFVLGRDKAGQLLGYAPAWGLHNVSLHELVNRFSKPHGGTSTSAGKTEAQLVWDNIQNNWMDAAIQSIGIGVGLDSVKSS